MKKGINLRHFPCCSLLPGGLLRLLLLITSFPHIIQSFRESIFSGLARTDSIEYLGETFGGDSVHPTPFIIKLPVTWPWVGWSRSQYIIDPCISC